MEEYQPLVGVASYGEDGSDFQDLLDAAELVSA
jgi:hypothetical protein